ncbi:MAG: 23S rRNA (adenine(2503)-C(2))-methyltransferase RlmN [Alphaproteobacteria bacterium]|nr:MAG: 23S rRNA (adenine(2503)-C(2))-methyltransferase RlmN [Alphaproteobacteria bacterium]
MGIESHVTSFAPEVVDATGRRDLVGLSREELVAAIAELGMESFRARQLWHWIYQRGVTDFESMSTLAKAARPQMAEHFVVGRPQIAQDMKSQDGTRKWLVRLEDKHEIETVHIPQEDRGTLCISSQVGCTLACRFCHTGTQKLVRNLNANEILGQFMRARDVLDDWSVKPGDRKITNIVLMGMGEPLYNYENVAKAMKIVMDCDGIAFSRRRITLSTSGVVPMMNRAALELGVNLAVSLHAVTDELRDQLVPLNRKYPIKELLDACRNYPGTHNARRITFEYVMLKGVNDSPAEARALVKLLRGIPAKVNLIPFNPWPGAPYERSTNKAIQAFGDIVNQAGYASPVRTPRGTDILAACGQLRSESVRQRKSEISGAPGA